MASAGPMHEGSRTIRHALPDVRACHPGTSWQQIDPPPKEQSRLTELTELRYTPREGLRGLQRWADLSILMKGSSVHRTVRVRVLLLSALKGDPTYEHFVSRQKRCEH